MSLRLLFVAPPEAVVAVVIVVALVAIGAGGWWRARRRTRLGIPSGVERRYTDHLRQRMAERDLTSSAIEKTLRAPHRRVHDAVERSYRFERDFADQMVKVWVAADPWPPRREVVIKSAAARRLATIVVPKARIGRLIGRGGSTIKQIRHHSGANLDVDDAGRVRITADTRAQVDQAIKLVRRAVG